MKIVKFLFTGSWPKQFSIYSYSHALTETKFLTFPSTALVAVQIRQPLCLPVEHVVCRLRLGFLEKE